MANYLNIPEYIPQLQSFHPDLNYYSNVLQAKQSQYDTAHKQISQQYGALLNAPMLRDGNVARRDKFFQTIEQDVKKISKLDLSQEQNVSTAMNVFRPIYQDKYIVKDMTFTKQLQNELGRADNLRNCIDPDKCGGQYWDTGVAAMKYKAEEFRNASDDESLSHAPPKFTPYINVADKAMKYAKDLGMDVQVEQSNGRYIIKSKNGALIKEPLYQALLAKFGNDPAVGEVYKTAAYVQRKDAIKGLTPQYGGNEDAAEAAYLHTSYTALTTKANLDHKLLTEHVDNLKGDAKAMQERIKKEGTTPDDSLYQAYAKVLQEVEQGDAAKNSTQQAVNIASAPMNLDRTSLRFKVDGLLAHNLLKGDLEGAASLYAATHGSQTIEADPYGVASANHSFRMQEMREQKVLDTEKMFLDYDLKAKLEAQKAAKLGKQGEQGNLVPVIKPAVEGTTAYVDPQVENRNKLEEKEKGFKGATDKFITDFGQIYQSLVKGEDPKSKKYKQMLSDVFGADYNPATNQFKSGTFTGGQNYQSNYGAAYIKAKKYLDSEKVSNGGVYPEGVNKLLPSAKSADDAYEVYGGISDIYKQNNLALVRTIPASTLIPSVEKSYVLGMFTKDGYQKTKGEFTKDNLSGAIKEQILKNPYDPSVKGMAATSESYPAYLNRMHQKAVSELDKKYGTAQGYLKILGEDVTVQKNMKQWNQHPGAAPGIGGAATITQQGAADSATPDSDATQGLVGVYTDLLQGNVEKVVSGSTDLSKGSYEKAEDDAQARAVLHALGESFTSGSFDAKNPIRPRAQFSITQNAANDAGLVAYTIIPTRDWAEQTQYKGTKSNAGPTAGGAYAAGITVYVRADKTKNPILSKFQQSDADLLLNRGPYKIDEFPNAAQNVTISRDVEGMKINGEMLTYQIGKDGKIIAVPTPITVPVLSNKIDAKEFIAQTKTYLQAVQQQNAEALRAYMEHRPNVIKNPDEIYVPKTFEEFAQTQGYTKAQ